MHRQAQELGLHRLPQSTEQTAEDSLECNLLKTWDLERRKRIWTRLFILDSVAGRHVLSYFFCFLGIFVIRSRAPFREMGQLT